ncbi:unnamed protein product [Brachionus calyciflorus]|uniref:Uncharacterized protein n=1 Tax=Brachionus calyciflorus TaxID=104777 RepID=A0A813MIV3_9BILA|nr:unnamed protein product [Brachionus calyciflorus]
MGGCANSKYAVDEDKQVKKEKKPFMLKKKSKKDAVDSVTPVVENVPDNEKPVEQPVEAVESKENVENEPTEAPKVEKEDIDFIDREEAEKAANAASENSTTVTQTESNDAKKEVTTYQTTVVKHTQKEGDELLQHLKDEAFKTLQSSLKNLNQNRTQTTTASSSLNETPETSTDDQTQDLLQQIKNQVLSSLGRTNEELINSILDAGASLIKDSKVKNMNELEEQLNNQFGEQNDLVKKVINSTTGFLTAKGTEAGVILSNILANTNSGIQGIMNETEKTTVKVTRTVTEQVLSGGQLKEITKIITSNETVSNPPANLEDIIKNISGDSKVVKSGTTVTSTTVNETQETVKEEVNESVVETAQSFTETTEKVSENVTSNSELNDQAEQVVNKVLNAAVEIVNQDDKEASEEVITNGYHHHHEQQESHVEENIKIEEESTVTTSTTKIILNGETGLEQVQSEFFKHGKQAAEEVINKLNTNEIVEISSN